MTHIIIRKAYVDDMLQLIPLLAQLGYPTTIQEFEKRFIKFISLPDYGIAVACAQEKIVGFVAWSRSILIVSDLTRIHIEGLIVDEHYRGQGIGKKLMLFVEEFSQQYSPVIIDLTSGTRRAIDRSHEFYKNLGYTNDGPMAKLYFRKVL